MNGSGVSRLVVRAMVAVWLFLSGTAWAQTITLDSVSSSPPFTAVANAVGSNIEERGILWWLPNGDESGLLPAGSGEGRFHLNLQGLTPGLTYHVKAYITVNGEVIHSDELLLNISGFTGGTPPTVVTTACRAIAEGTLAVSGQIKDFGGSPVTEWGFVYDLQPGPALPVPGQAGRVCEGSQLDKEWKFSGVIGGLPPGTWYVRAYARNENPISSTAQAESVGYGQELMLTTSSGTSAEANAGGMFSPPGLSANSAVGMGPGQVSLTILNASSQSFIVRDPILTTSTGVRLAIPFAQVSIHQNKSALFTFDCPEMSQITDSCTFSFTVTPLNKPSRVVNRTLGDAGKILEVTDSLLQ